MRSQPFSPIVKQFALPKNNAARLSYGVPLLCAVTSTLGAVVGGATAQAAPIAPKPARKAPLQQTKAAQNSVARMARKPNIVFILADDLGWADVGFHGGQVKTPNIDRLAAGGVRLEQFYVQPLCSPTRAALMTGRYPMRQGLQVGVINPWARYGLPLNERTLAQSLRAEGYTTAITGKWHLGHARPEYLPTRRGFDHQYGSYVSSTHFEHTPTFRNFRPLDWHRDDKALKEEGYSSDLVTREAQRLIGARDTKRPMFLYVAYNTPHIPLQAPPAYLARYAHIADEKRRTYAAMVSCMDDGIGRLLATLDERGLRDNTLIVFTSDNGGWLKNGASADNGPLRGQKGTLYEGGVRVPAIASWKGVLKPGIVNEVLHVVDWYPTLVKLAGGAVKQPLPLDGHDAWPTIADGAPSPHSEIVLNIAPNRSALRRGKWKFIVSGSINAEDENAAPEAELFDIAADPFEKTNLAAQNPATVVQLRARLKALTAQSMPPQNEGRPKDVIVPEVLGEPVRTPAAPAR